jgi:hypothetical protein
MNNLIGSYIDPLSSAEFKYYNYQRYLDWMYKYSNQEFLDIFIDIKSPIFIIKNKFMMTSPKRETYGYELIINPCLGDFKLQSAFNPVHAYQEIEMYLSNKMLLKDDCDIYRADDAIRDSKGFTEWSFRNRRVVKKKIK